MDEHARKGPDHKLARFLGLDKAPELAEVVYPFAPLNIRERLLWLLNRCVIRDEAYGQWRKVCPNCHLPLPRKTANGEISSEVIAIIGARGSGKSNFFGVLLDALKRRYSHEVGFLIFDEETWSVREHKAIASEKLYRSAMATGSSVSAERVAIDRDQRVETSSESRYSADLSARSFPATVALPDAAVHACLGS